MRSAKPDSNMTFIGCGLTAVRKTSTLSRCSFATATSKACSPLASIAGHVAHAKDHHARFPAGTAQCHVQFFGRGEKQWALDAIKDYALRDVLAADAVRSDLRVFIFLGDETHVRHFLHLAEEQDHRHDQSGPDADREIEDHREREDGDEDREVRARSAPELDEGMQLRHPKSDREQNRAERRERHIGCERRRDENDREQDERMHDGGHGCACARANICRRAGDRAS